MADVIISHGVVRRCYGAAAVTLVAVGVCIAIVQANPTVPGGIVPPCPTKALLHLDCPGCGTTRMLYSVLHLDLGAAAHYNALALGALPLLIATYVTFVLSRVLDRPIRQWYQFPAAPQLAVVALAAWCVVRNIPAEPFRALRV